MLNGVESDGRRVDRGALDHGRVPRPELDRQVVVDDERGRGLLVDAIGGGDAEVDELVDAACLDHIARFDVAVHETRAVNRRERRRNQGADRERLDNRQPTLAREPPVQRGAGDVLHREAHDPARLIGRQGVEAHDAGVLHLAERPRFGNHARTVHGRRRAPAAGRVEGEELHRRGAKLCRAVDLLGEPDGREAAATQWCDQQEGAEAALAVGEIEEAPESAQRWLGRRRAHAAASFQNPGRVRRRRRATINVDHARRVLRDPAMGCVMSAPRAPSLAGTRSDYPPR